ncbi:terpene synthase family protein [Corallococcus terminator]
MQTRIISELEHVRVPVITLPWQGACSPDIERLEKTMLAWASRYGLLLTAKHRARVERARYASFSGRSFPHAGPELLQALTDFTAWLFIIDDHAVDRVDPLNETTLSQLTAVLDVLDLDQMGPEPVFGERALRDVCQRLRSLLSPEHFARFAHGIRMWAGSAGLQIIAHLLGRPLALRPYRAFRRHTGGVNPSMALIDAANAGPLSPEEYNRPSVERLRLHVNNIASWANDLHSLHTEAREPDQSRNMAMIYAAQGHSLQEGADYTARQIQAEISAFQEEAAVLERAASKELRGFISGLREWLSGYHDWVDQITHRYREEYAEQDASDQEFLLVAEGQRREAP